MKRLIIFYDPQCGLCGRFRRWMLGQESYLQLEFVPYDGAQARRLLPEIVHLGADREIVVMNEEGEIWQGPGAWVTCLWALREGRAWARRLASPALLPLAGKVCHLISANRLTLSRVMGLKGEEDLAEACTGQPEHCVDGTCRLPEGGET